jgi:hypothetical protein
LIKLSVEHPIWAKAIIYALPKDLKVFFIKKEPKINVG